MPVTLRQVFESPHLRGLYGLAPVRQTKPNACGACCMATALRYFGTPVTEQNCVDAMGTNDAIGTHPLAMLKYGREKSFKTCGYTKYPLDRLLGRVSAGAVSLIRWPDRSDHWNLVAGIEPLLKHLVVADPASPHLFELIHLDDFEQRWAASERLAVYLNRPLPGREGAPTRQTRLRIEPYRETMTVDGHLIALPPS